MTVAAGAIGFLATAGSPLTTAATLSAAKISAMEVGENLTLVFGEAKSASTDLDNSIMAQIGANSGQQCSFQLVIWVQRQKV